MKAILVMDMPKSCDECPLCRRELINAWLEQYGDVCLFSYEDITDECYFKRPDWCPLRPVLEK